MDWLKLFKRQNKYTIIVVIAFSMTGLGFSVYSLSGTKYNVIEFCFRPQVVNNPKTRYCTKDKRYIIPQGYWRQEDYVPANPRFQPQGTFILSDKATRLRTILATNPNAKNWAGGSLILLFLSTLLISKRLRRYKREFIAYFEQLKTDLNQEILTNEQRREISTHKIAVETEYIKDRITHSDQMTRLSDKSPGELEFEQEQIEKNNELVELQRQLQIAQLKAEIAKFDAEAAKYNAHQSPPKPESVETAKEIDYKALCPGVINGVEFYDWRNLIDDSVGIIISGNSGSGKTSVATWAAGWLTKDEPAQVLVLDPHANVNILWKELGLHTIYEFSLIEKQLEMLLELLDYRRSLQKEQLDLEDSVIVFADELGGCLSSFEDGNSVDNAIKRLGCEARKYRITLIGLNHSSNAKDTGKDVSAQIANNYLRIGLNATAKQIASRWKKDDPRRKYVQDTDYVCIISGSVPEQVAIHPTHHTYKKFKKSGNKPKGLLPINQLPITIPLAQAVPKDKDWYEEFIDLKDSLERVPNTEEIKLKWKEVMGVECSSKQAETIHEYLTSLN